MVKNVLWFKYICAIGGTEVYLWEMAKKYGKDYDIEIWYERGDAKQVERLSQYVRCRQWKAPQIIECDKFFANFNLEICAQGYVKAKEYYFVVHANFNELGYKPNIKSVEHLSPKFIAVSKWARDKFIEFTGKPCEYCYNPLTLEPKEKVINLVSACRLDDKVKGGQRTLALIKRLDQYAELHKRHYIWHIFTNDVKLNINSPNVCLMQRRVDVRPYMSNADYVLQLSNDMETYCYTLNEAWGYGVHTISTPLSVLKELPIPEGANKVLDRNLENIDEIVEYIFNNQPKVFKYEPPKDRWFSLLEEGESQYRKELKTIMKARMTAKANGLPDKYTGVTYYTGDIIEVSKVRFDELKAGGYCEEVEELKEEIIENAVEKPKAVKKAVRKTTKKK